MASEQTLNTSSLEMASHTPRKEKSDDVKLLEWKVENLTDKVKRLKK